MSKQKLLLDVLSDSEKLKLKDTYIRNHYIHQLTIGEVMHLTFVIDGVMSYTECFDELIRRATV